MSAVPSAASARPSTRVTARPQRWKATSSRANSIPEQASRLSGRQVRSRPAGARPVACCPGVQRTRAAPAQPQAAETPSSCGCSTSRRCQRHPCPSPLSVRGNPRGNRSRARLMDSPRPLPWEPDPRYRKAVAYFSMEYAIDQALKIYAGGLGFLAGSHMRSAHDLQQNLVGIGILWKYGYYDQVRDDDQCMRVQFIMKYYPFLQPSDLRAQVSVNGHPVHIRVLRLAPETFGTAPVYLLTTDIPENDYLARTITHRLYDTEPA